MEDEAEAEEDQLRKEHNNQRDYISQVLQDPVQAQNHPGHQNNLNPIRPGKSPHHLLDELLLKYRSQNTDLTRVTVNSAVLSHKPSAASVAAAHKKAPLDWLE